VEQVASQCDGVDVRTIDVAAEPARFVALGVSAIPAIVIDGRLEFAGLPSEAQLRQRIDAARARA
jgi:hypothetical protein